MEHLYIKILRKELEERIISNENYSLRRFAIDLELAPTVLAEVFRHKRELPAKYSKSIALKLGLSSDEYLSFCESIKSSHIKLKDISKQQFPLNKLNFMDDSYSKLLTNWRYFSYLSLQKTKFSICDEEEKSKLLNCSLDDLQVIIEDLINLKLIERGNDGVVKILKGNLDTPFDTYSQALRQGYKNAFDQTKEKIDSVPIKERYLGSNTFALKKEDIPQLKNILREFRLKTAKNYEDKEGADSVYRLSLQLIPLVS